MEFVFSFLSNLIDNLRELYLFYSYYYKKLNDKINEGARDVLICEIIENSFHMKKFLVEIFWKKTKYFKVIKKKKVDMIVMNTINLLELNIKDIMIKSPENFHVNVQIEIIFDSDEETNNNFFEENILATTKTINTLLSGLFFKKIKMKKDENKVKKESTIMIYNIFDAMLNCNNNSSITCFKTSKKDVKQISSRFYYDVTNKTF
jgi:hypothetical protein